jgi:hypothetical protein
MEGLSGARRLAVGRIALGAFAIFATKLFARIFAGREAAEDGVILTTGRLYGIREVAIGLATAEAIARGEGIDLRIGLDLVVDAADGLFVILGWRALLPWGRALGLGIAGLYAAKESALLLARARGDRPEGAPRTSQSS